MLCVRGATVVWHAGLFGDHDAEDQSMNQPAAVLLVRFKTSLTEDEVMNVANERAPEFRALKGLQQKYYLRDAATGEVDAIARGRVLAAPLRRKGPAAFAIECQGRYLAQQRYRLNSEWPTNRSLPRSAKDSWSSWC